MKRVTISLDMEEKNISEVMKDLEATFDKYQDIGVIERVETDINEVE